MTETCGAGYSPLTEGERMEIMRKKTLRTLSFLQCVQAPGLITDTSGERAQIMESRCRRYVNPEVEHVQRKA